MNTAMILCAGFGTRMQEFTRNLPKPMLPVDGKPILEHTIGHLAGAGIENIIINLHYLPEKITEYFGDGKRFGVRIAYSYEESPLGTAGAVKKAEKLFGAADEFLVLYGDVISDEDYIKMNDNHRTHDGAIATIVLHERNSSNSVVEMNSDGRITRFIERPASSVVDKRQNWVNSGLYLFNSAIFNAIPAGVFCDFPRDIFTNLVISGKIYGYPLNGYRCAIDSAERYRKVQDDYKNGKIFIRH